MKSFAEIDIENNGNYLNFLSAISMLSGLFSDSSVPFINYRVAENIFCRSFNADNLSRSDTAFDANYNSVGVGLKTFVCNKDNSFEKVAEFNSLSNLLSDYQGKDLAFKLAYYRNQRIELAKRLYNIEKSLYHIVARRNQELLLFETDYEKIDMDNINSVKSKSASLHFEDGKNLYSFSYSKSTLFRKFQIPEKSFKLPINIIDDPFSLLLELFKDRSFKHSTNKLLKGVNYVILPLYGIKNKQKFVHERSGLNQWNARGRNRNMGEVYIKIPSEIHRMFPHFFPQREVVFKLKIPTGDVFQAKVCQDNSKALMTNPNKALSDWLLRNVFQLEEGELLTIEKINVLGFDSVVLIKDEFGDFQIDKAKIGSYESFIFE